MKENNKSKVFVVVRDAIEDCNGDSFSVKVFQNVFGNKEDAEAWMQASKKLLPQDTFDILEKEIVLN